MINGKKLPAEVSLLEEVPTNPKVKFNEEEKAGKFLRKGGSMLVEVQMKEKRGVESFSVSQNRF